MNAITPNVYFTQGTKNEQYLVEDLIIESLSIYGQQLTYIPRTLVAKDEILGEDRLSEFKNAFPIEMYFDNVDKFGGNGAFIEKFGLSMQQNATLTVSRRRWEQLIGRYNATQLPQRPCEGDLLYFPLTKSLFEIKFVQHQNPFYQLGKLYVYKLDVELFQYASEKIDTGMRDVDVFESLKTLVTDTTRSPYGEVIAINMTNNGSNYNTATVSIVPNVDDPTGAGATAEAVVNPDGNIIRIDVTNKGIGYQIPPTVVITGDGTSAAATAVIKTNVDKVMSFGDNNKFKEQAEDIVFNTSNPFGDVVG